MKQDIIIAGVGGQGILSIAAIIGHAVLENGLHIKQSEVHGMAQRGGAVHANIRISDQEIYSDVIPHGNADLILAVEPVEALRYLPWLSPDGWLVSNEVPFKNIPNYPDEEKVLGFIKNREHHFLFDARKIAEEHGSARAVNMAMLGAASEFLKLPEASLEESIRVRFSQKGEKVIESNLNVFKSSRRLVENNIC